MNGIVVFFILHCAPQLLWAAMESDEIEICQPEGFEKCRSNEHCCSEYCDKDPEDEFGVCMQACGKIPSKLADSIEPNSKGLPKLFPWNAGIYRYSAENNFYDFKCGGTLISNNLVVSIADCFITKDGILRDLSTYKVALGKYYRAFNASEDSSSQIFDIQSFETKPYVKKLIIIPYEIVLLVLKNDVEYTRAVRPVCIDIDKTVEKNQLSKGTIGKLVAWGGMAENETIEALKLVKMPFILSNECRAKVSDDYLGYVDVDVICAGVPNDTICHWRLGEGLVFQNPYTDVYYLHGVSLFPPKCKNETISLFLKLSSRKEVIDKYMDNCNGLCKICGRPLSNSKQSIGSNNSLTDNQNIPWYASIYILLPGMKLKQCGGALISHKVVVTSAHCIVTEDEEYRKIRIFNVSMMKVEFGRDTIFKFNTSDLFDVQKIEISPEFRGTKSFQYNDIGFVTLKTQVEYSRNVIPICVDLSRNSFEEELRLKERRGFVAIISTDFRLENFGQQFIEMKEIPVNTKEECVEFLKFAPLYMFKEDRFCSIDTSTHGSTLDENEIGDYTLTRGATYPEKISGGLYIKDPKTQAYYLRGMSNIVDKNHTYIFFTRLTYHRQLLKKYVPDCVQRCSKKQCDPLISKKLHLICSTTDGKLAPCNKPLFNNSTATFSCNPLSHMIIKEQSYNTISCKDGEWNLPLIDDFCAPAFAECGKAVSDIGQAVVSHGKTIEIGQFPWHAGIYEYQPGTKTYDQICGGTLISHKVVVTAAHCFATEENRKIYLPKLWTIKVELGKYHRIFNSSEDNSAQTLDVEKIELSPHYHGFHGQLSNDIAFVTLKTKATYTNAVRPVCIDIGPNNFEEEQLVNGTIGKVVGWGLTADQVPSENLTLAEMPFVPLDECRTKIDISLVKYLAIDKICAGNKSSSMTVCPGDSGGGLVFENPTTNAYYLRGIVSLGKRGCKGKEYSLFTKLSAHKTLLGNYLKLEEEPTSPPTKLKNLTTDLNQKDHAGQILSVLPSSKSAVINSYPLYFPFLIYLWSKPYFL